MPPERFGSSSAPRRGEVEAVDALWRSRARRVAMVTVGYLTLGWLLFVLIDVLNVAGSREVLIGLMPNKPAIWIQLFQEGRLTEWLQWLALGVAGLIAAVHAGRLWNDRDEDARRLAMFWVLISLALTLMLIEDAGNPRHTIRQYSYHIIDGAMFGRAVEFSFLALLASIPVYALLRHWSVLRRHALVHRYVLAAFVIYAIAGISSATRHWYEWHERVGEAALAWFRQIDEGFVTYQNLDREGYWLMDMIVEESAELLGAAMFLCAVVAFTAVVWKSEQARRVAGAVGQTQSREKAHVR